MYARNYRPGPLWLPGRVLERQVTVMCKIRLGDAHVIVHHMDQQSPRVTNEDPTTVESDRATDNVDPDINISTETETETVSAESGRAEELEVPPQPTTAGDTPRPLADTGADAEVDI